MVILLKDAKCDRTKFSFNVLFVLHDLINNFLFNCLITHSKYSFFFKFSPLFFSLVFFSLSNSHFRLNDHCYFFPLVDYSPFSHSDMREMRTSLLFLFTVFFPSASFSINISFLISKYDFSCTIMLISFLVRNFLVRYLSYVVYHLLFITCASRIRFWDIYFHLTKQFILIKTEWYIKLIQKMNNNLLEKLKKKKEKKTCDLFYFFIRRILRRLIYLYTYTLYY